MKNAFVPFAMTLALATTAQASPITRQFICVSPFHETESYRLLTLVYDPAQKEGFGISSVEWAILKKDDSTKKLKIDRKLEIGTLDHVKANSMPVAYSAVFNGGFTRIQAYDSADQSNHEVLIQSERMVSAELSSGMTWVQELQPLRQDKGDSDGVFKLYRWACSLNSR